MMFLAEDIYRTTEANFHVHAKNIIYREIFNNRALFAYFDEQIKIFDKKK